MKIAVVQHALRPAPAQDLEALVLAAGRAAALGAEVVFLPEVAAVHDGPLGVDLYRRLDDDAPGVAIVTAHVEVDDDADVRAREAAALGEIVVLTGDDAIDVETLAECAKRAPGLVVLAPGSESELQAEAVLELAVALSTSLASVVVVVETDGAAVGEPGHGGSAVVHLGQVLGEAVGGDDLLVAEVPAPLGPPEAPEPLPVLPPVLAQRLGAHRGRKVDVGYPADLD